MQGGAAGREAAGRAYPLSTVVVVALIAFLVGSLLRSLLSPADFIYVVTDEKEIGSVDAGWREIKRLLVEASAAALQAEMRNPTATAGRYSVV